MNVLLRHLAATREVFTIDDAAACGVDRHTLDRMVRAGVFHRVGRAAFVSSRLWAYATVEQRHLLRCRAVLPRYRSAALSHTSAVVAHGLPTYRADLDTVHLTRTNEGRSGRVGRQTPVQVHPPLPNEARTTIDGLPSCVASVAVLQVADWQGIEAGMVAAEAGLHRGMFTTDDLRWARGVARLGRGRARADLVVRLAGPHSESPGETLTLLMLRALGVAAQQQAPIELSSGIARVDFLLPDRVVVEFDGAMKYEGADGRAALVREKRREDGIRAAGYQVVRLTWPDLSRPAHVRDALEAARVRAHGS